MSSHSEARGQGQPRRTSLGSSAIDIGWPQPMRASGGGSPEGGDPVTASSGRGPAWRRSRDDAAGYGRYGRERGERSSEQESINREHIRSSGWQPQPLRLPQNRRADDVRRREAEYRRMATDEENGEEFRRDPRQHPRDNSREPHVEGFGNKPAIQSGIHAPSPGSEADDTAAHTAVQHLERLHTEIQLQKELKTLSRAGEATAPERDTSQCVYYSPRDERYKRAAQYGLPLPIETPESEAARHKAMAERVCRLLTETDFNLSALSIMSDTSSGLGPGTQGPSEPRASAPAVRKPEPGSEQQDIPRPRAHRKPVTTPKASHQGVPARPRMPSSKPREPQQQQQQQQPQQPQPSHRPPPPRPEIRPTTLPASDEDDDNEVKPLKIPTKTAFSKRHNKKAGWKVTLPPGHSTRPPGLFNPADKMLERQRRARLNHALHARHHTGGTPPLRGEWYRRELARAAEKEAAAAAAAAQAQATAAAAAKRTPESPVEGEGRGGGGQKRGDGAAVRKSRHRHRRDHVRIQEPGGRSVEPTTAPAAPREPCAGCHQSKRRAKASIRKYGFCFRCLRKHLVNLGELRSCVECRSLRVKEDYFLYDKNGGRRHEETRVCVFCRWQKKKGKCEAWCGRPG